MQPDFLSSFRFLSSSYNVDEDGDADDYDNANLR